MAGKKTEEEALAVPVAEAKAKAGARDAGETALEAVAPGKPGPAQAAPEAAPPGEADPALAERLEKMERLLEKQAEDTEKIRRGRRTTNGLLACLAAVLAAGLIWLNATVAGATRQLPALMEQAEGALQSVAELDVEALNGAIGEMERGLAAVDFEALNSSIENLQKAAEGLARLMRIFG